MHGVSKHDGGRDIDWGRTSADYARFRPGYPTSLFERLRALGVGLPGHRVLDLGTGTGNVARALARAGCDVVGVDVAAEQIETARALAADEGLGNARFAVAPAEDTGQPNAAFDVVTAAQCWLYFDRDRAVCEVQRVLDDGGVLVTCHLCWLPLVDETAARSEALVLEHNPQWSAAGWHGRVPPAPAWIGDDFVVHAMFFYDEALPFTRESWRGRFRACRGVGASLTPAQIEAFDRAHAALLDEIVPEEFTVLHRIDAHVLAPARM